MSLRTQVEFAAAQYVIANENRGWHYATPEGSDVVQYVPILTDRAQHFSECSLAKVTRLDLSTSVDYAYNQANGVESILIFSASCACGKYQNEDFSREVDFSEVLDMLDESE
jgi:hypothetical protein